MALLKVCFYRGITSMAPETIGPMDPGSPAASSKSTDEGREVYLQMWEWRMKGSLANEKLIGCFHFFFLVER